MEQRGYSDRSNGGEGSSFGQQQRMKLWYELSHRAGSVVTDRHGIVRYVTQAPHVIRQCLRQADPAKEVVSFIDINVLAKSPTAGQQPQAILPQDVLETINVNEIALVERITSPFPEAEFVGLLVQETDGFQSLRPESGRSERELVTAGH